MSPHSDPFTAGVLDGKRDRRRGAVDDRQTFTEDPPVLTLDQVSAMLHRAAIAKSRIAELETTAKMDHERIDHALGEATDGDRRAIADIEAQVEQFWRRRLAEDPDAKKSVKLPWGSVESRELPLEYERDDAVLREWATDAGYLRESKPIERPIDWERIKKEGRVIDGELRVKLASGDEAVPGVAVRKRDPKVTVTIYGN